MLQVRSSLDSSPDSVKLVQPKLDPSKLLVCLDKIISSDAQLIIIKPTFSHFQLGKVYGIESYVLSPAETKDLYPLMNVDDLYGTLYVPKDGTMDPAGTCTTLTRAASARGATVTQPAAEYHNRKQ